VKEVRPLIEEGGRILQEANGMVRGLDPDGRIQANAKHKSATREATPEEFHLADVLKELTGTVTTTIDGAKKKLEGMPHAKKQINPLWGLLNEPLFQILAAVGLLLNGVLSLVGRLVSHITSIVISFSRHSLLTTNAAARTWPWWYNRRPPRHTGLEPCARGSRSWLRYGVLDR
jgi:hypothetical protein